jgi:hypothetical protein
MSRFGTLRAVVTASFIAAALLTTSVVNVLASGGNGPFPK